MVVIYLMYVLLIYSLTVKIYVNLSCEYSLMCSRIMRKPKKALGHIAKMPSL